MVNNKQISRCAKGFCVTQSTGGKEQEVQNKEDLISTVSTSTLEFVT